MCRTLRAEGSDGPITFLTARDTPPEDRVSGVTKAGDNYVIVRNRLDRIRKLTALC